VLPGSRLSEATRDARCVLIRRIERRTVVGERIRRFGC
jgi:hypothetical protein